MKTFFLTKTGLTKIVELPKMWFEATWWPKIFFKRAVFSIIFDLFGLIITKKYYKESQILHKELINLFWNKKSRKKIFVRKFSLFWPIFRGKSHFQRDETRDAEVSRGWGRYQIVPRAKGYKSSHIKRLRVEALTSGGQFTEKKSQNYATKWSKFFQKFFWSLVRGTLYYPQGVLSNWINLIANKLLG